MGDEADSLDSAVISCIREAGGEPTLWEKSGLDERFGDHVRRRHCVTEAHLGGSSQTTGFSFEVEAVLPALIAGCV